MPDARAVEQGIAQGVDRVRADRIRASPEMVNRNRRSGARYAGAAAGLLFLALLAAQLVRPAAPRGVLAGDGTLLDHVAVPDRVQVLLRRACSDCHSDKTRWPWYARIAPISWLVARDVQRGRSNLDFSRWSTDPVREPTPLQRLRWICRDIQQEIMPPRLYRLAHPEARLSEQEQDRICAWTEDALRQVSNAAASRQDPTH